MPEPLSEYPEIVHANFPWDEWLQPGVWRFVRGVDFTSTPKAFVESARVAARDRGLGFRGGTREGRYAVIEIKEEPDA